jgi:hypothetical protein
LLSSGRFIFQEKTLFFFSQVDSSPIWMLLLQSMGLVFLLCTKLGRIQTY